MLFSRRSSRPRGLAALLPGRALLAALLLALLGLFGLLSALLGDGLYDLLSWLALGTPLVLVGWVWLRLPRTRRNP